MAISKTNMKKVMGMYKTFINFSIEDTPFSPMIICHPVFECGTYPYMENGEIKELDIYNSDADFNIAVKKQLEVVEKCDTFEGVLMFIRKPYKLTFLKYCKAFVSNEDFSRVLGDLWTMIENGNHDINVSKRQIASWFRMSNKNFLMDNAEREYLASLPDEFYVYRGVGGKVKNPKGLSWTNDYDLAVWFAKRWQQGGYVIKGKVKKEDVLAYFSDRVGSSANDFSETEIVIEPFKVQEQEIVCEFEVGEE